MMLWKKSKDEIIKKEQENIVNTLRKEIDKLEKNHEPNKLFLNIKSNINKRYNRFTGFLKLVSSKIF